MFPDLCNVQNRLLRSLSDDEFQLLRAFFEPVKLKVNDLLVQRLSPIRHLHFIEDGMASIVSAPERSRCVQVSCVGREGMTGIPVLLDLTLTPLETFVQVSGTAFRIPADAMRGAIDASPSLHRKLLKYSYTATLQTVEAAHSFSHNTVAERLARWLLLAHDRANSDDIFLTHTVLASMIGARRAGVTDAVAILEGEGMIKAMRGHIIVLDRDALIVRTAGCYGSSEAEYARTIGKAVWPRPSAA
ncbi:Crp/Fnr family transcriptional regulator [Aureimonas fodinaquatilis]|nr:Crp/Fnr family transcriptional regulator [Aureimonas fodinaquatilis]